MQNTKNQIQQEKYIKRQPQLQELQIIEQLTEQQQYIRNSINYYASFQQQLSHYEGMLKMQINDEIAKFQIIKNQLIDQQRQIEDLAQELLKYEGTYDQILASSNRQTEKCQRESKILWQELQRLNCQNNELQLQLLEFQKKSKDIQNQQRILNQQYQKLSNQQKQKQKELENIYKTIEVTGKKMEETFLLKKRLNNELQQQRGNIRVYCRIRPFHMDEQQQNFMEISNDTTLKLKVPKQIQKSVNHQKDYIFNFQQIFGQTQKQVNIFNQLAQLIQSSVDGNTVTIFAYGQTGSGKTFTMQGGQESQQRGIIPRSIQLIFDQIQRAKSFNWDYKVLVSIQQIYLETVRDLLSQDGQFIQFQIKCPRDIEILFEKAMAVRKVAETQCNQRSSRSHLIFTLKLEAYNAKTSKSRKGCLNLIDLAGSQRVTVSKVEGDRLKETQSINKSLTHLGDVISSLANKQQHIPYRNSKLTYVLQNSLATNCKTLMFVNISPNTADFNQTLCSLRFAEKVKECKIKKDTFK